MRALIGEELGAAPADALAAAGDDGPEALQTEVHWRLLPYASQVFSMEAPRVYFGSTILPTRIFPAWVQRK
ncbi:hypothetical protein GCM10011504_15240 [Siccirubricoccus deserti]|nr:hypothetical protein GCM10011504_15240 [Siccirubricoccus deserti]